MAVSETYTYINRSVADLLAEPDEKSERISQAIYATAILILKKEREWIQVQTPDSYTSWCREEDLITRQTAYRPVVRVKTLWTYLFPTESQKTVHTMQLPYGTGLELIEESVKGPMIQVVLLDGQKEWVNRDCLDDEIATLDAILEEARTFLHIRYLWGGNSSFGIDCSGFMQTLFLQLGAQLPRDSHLQAKAVQEIPRGQEQKGDLLFFDNANSQKVTHVGLYLGDNRFIHAIRPEVEITRIEEGSSWSKKLLLSGRVAFNQK